ncbi:MAG: hypothetical protein GF315_02985 [candidate division Zixibacteria bacterium]|nr:hypothetical protein [candidate division Zixibacteria bacterium]
MKTIFSSLFLILFLLTCVSEIYAVEDAVVDSIVLKAIEQVHNEQFLKAVETFKDVRPMRPGTPMPYFYIAATYLALITEYRNPTYRPLFEAYIDSAVTFGEKRDDATDATAEDYFYYGGALGYRGIYKSEQGDWWGAFKDGARARGKLEKALEMDSTNFDIYYGLGSYDFWRSVKTEVFWWLPFFSDKRQQGIEYMWKAAEKGKYSQREVKYALIRVYHEIEEWEKMFEVWFKYLEDVNPDDPYALWWLADGYAQLGQWGNCEEMYKKLFGAIEESEFYHPDAEVELRYKIAVAQKNQNKTEKAIENLRKGISLELKISDVEKANQYLEDSKELLENILSR